MSIDQTTSQNVNVASIATPPIVMCECCRDSLAFSAAGPESRNFKN